MSTAPRKAPLAIPGDEFRALGHALVDQIAGFLDGIAERPVARNESPEEVRRLVDTDAALPDDGAYPAELLSSTARLLFDHSLFNGHPRFFGYVTSSPAPIGMLGDLLAAAVNPNVGAWRLAPVATEIEAQAVRWVAELMGYPTDCSGLFVSGGNMANFVGLLTARFAAADWDLRATGIAPPTGAGFRVYVSAETHTWIQKGCDLAGIGTDAIRWLPVDAELRMDTRALRERIAEDRATGARPLMVVGTAGSVGTGAVDPLAEIGAICREEKIWFHVDGAYGALAGAVPGAPVDLKALGLADSIAVDPHKWLYAPLEAGCLLTRHAEALRQAFSYHPPYYHFGQEAINYLDLGPQNSRGFRALKVWLALRSVGRRGYVEMMGDDVRLSRAMHEHVRATPELEACTQSLSISTFRYVPPDLRDGVGTEAVESYLNELNEALLDRVQCSGEAFVSNAVVDGRYLLRACIVNFRTGEADVRAVPELAVRLGRETDEELRAKGRLPAGIGA